MTELCIADEPRPLFHQVAHSFGIQAPPNHGLPHEFLCDAGLKRYIRPFVDYVMRELPEEKPNTPAVAVSRDQLTFEFLKELFYEYEHNPLPTHWIKHDDIWKRVVEKYGESLSSKLATAAFNHLYAGCLINQVNGPGHIKNIQINERGIAAYQLMNAGRISSTPSPTVDPQTVFVVHGRNEAIRNSMFDFLRAIGLRPLEWSQAIAATGEATPYIGQVLDTAFSKAQAVVVLMTPDDEAWLKKEFQTEHDEQYEKQPTGQARPNVLFEAGMAMGRNPKRTVLVQIGNLRPFSDVGGRHVLRLDNSSQRRQDLAERLKAAGCPVELSGRDWHTTGSFKFQEIRSSVLQRAIPPAVGERLTAEEIELLTSTGNDGSIHIAGSSAYGRMVAHHSKSFFDPEDGSVQAKYLDAIDRLSSTGFVRMESSDHYKLTTKGFESKKALTKEMPPSMQENMGVLWKRTTSGFEKHPYCSECSHHPIMTLAPPSRPMFWMCSAGHQAPRSVVPPASKS